MYFFYLFLLIHACAEKNICEMTIFEWDVKLYNSFIQRQYYCWVGCNRYLLWDNLPK